MSEKSKEKRPKKKKTKIYRQYQDFYTAEDLRDPDTIKPLNLTIEDFDARGHVRNPPAPCVVTTIDPDYTKAARQQKLVKKFRIKTDILQLREITRKRFMMYAIWHRHLEKQRVSEHNETVYKRIMDFHKFAEASLSKMESQAFYEMLEANKTLQRLREVQVTAELKEVMAAQECVLTEVQAVYGRLLFLLKLISYFHNIGYEETDGNGSGSALPKQTDLVIVNLSGLSRDPTYLNEVIQIENYLDNVVKPYLAKRHYSNADVWIQGFEMMRHKISNYNRRFTQLALLNHILAVIYDKFQKTYSSRIVKPLFLKDSSVLKARVEALSASAVKVIDDFEEKYKQDKLNFKLVGIVPIILENVEWAMTKYSIGGNGKAQQAQTKPTKSQSASASSGYKDQQDATLAKVEKIQANLLHLLNEFDAISPTLCKSVERHVRRRVALEKETSRRALEKQNRMRNWMEHFKKHELQRPK